MSERLEDHGFAAFAREDTDDARRGRPAVSLADYAQARGLEFHDQARLAGFRAVLPRYPEEQHNLMRGVLPGGQFGVLLHELLQTHAGPDQSDPLGGEFHNVRVTSAGGARGFLGRLTGIRGDPPDRAFAVPGAWAPTTTAGFRVPQTNGPLPHLRIGRGARMNRSALDLAPLGAPGWAAYHDDRLDHEVLARTLAGGLAGLLHRLELPYAAVEIGYGGLVVRRNGYVTDAGELDAFAQTTGAIADAVAAGCGPDATAPFAEPLPPCPWAADGAICHDAAIAAAWAPDMRAYAQRHGLELEDADAWPARYGRLPVPGRVYGVMRAPSGVRVLFTADAPILRLRALRVVVAFGLADPVELPSGGVRPQEGIVVETGDGVGVVWPTSYQGYCKDADGFVETALAAASQAGVRPAA